MMAVTFWSPVIVWIGLSILFVDTANKILSSLSLSLSLFYDDEKQSSLSKWVATVISKSQ